MALKDLSHDSLADSKKQITRAAVKKVKEKLSEKVTDDELKQIKDDVLDELQAEYLSFYIPALWDGDIADD